MLGSTVERDLRFLGQTYTYRRFVTANGPNTVVEFKVENSFPMLVRHDFEDLPRQPWSRSMPPVPCALFWWVTPFMT